MNKGVETGIIVALALVIGGGLLWAHSQHQHGDNAVITEEGNHLVSYSSSHEGLAFEYPDTATTTFHHEGPEGADWHVLSVIDKALLAASTTMSEAPPAIIILGAFDQPAGMPLADWIKTSPHANFNLSSDKVLSSTTIDGEPALAYTYDGLYMTDAVAVAHEGGIYLFTAQWASAEDPIRAQFKSLLQTVQFIP